MRTNVCIREDRLGLSIKNPDDVFRDCDRVDAALGDVLVGVTTSVSVGTLTVGAPMGAGPASVSLCTTVATGVPAAAAGRGVRSG